MWRIVKYPSDRWLRESETSRQTNNKTTNLIHTTNNIAQSILPNPSAFAAPECQQTKEPTILVVLQTNNYLVAKAAVHYANLLCGQRNCLHVPQKWFHTLNCKANHWLDRPSKHWDACATQQSVCYYTRLADTIFPHLQSGNIHSSKLVEILLSLHWVLWWKLTS